MTDHPALTFGERTLAVADLIEIGRLSGTWPAFVAATQAGLALDRDVPAEDLRAAATAFRYERGLLAAADFRRWLDEARLTSADLAGVLRAPPAARAPPVAGRAARHRAGPVGGADLHRHDGHAGPRGDRPRSPPRTRANLNGPDALYDLRRRAASDVRRAGRRRGRRAAAARPAPDRLAAGDRRGGRRSRTRARRARRGCWSREGAPLADVARLAGVARDHARAARRGRAARGRRRARGGGAGRARRAVGAGRRVAADRRHGQDRRRGPTTPSCASAPPARLLDEALARLSAGQVRRHVPV